MESRACKLYGVGVFMINAMKMLAKKKGWSVNASNADHSCKVNFMVDSQRTVEDVMGEICTYTDHIYMVENGTLSLYDKLKDSGTVNVKLSEVLLDGVSYDYNSITKGWKSNWVTYGLDKDKYELSSTKKSTRLDSGINAGDFEEIDPLDTKKENIDYILGRKKRLFEYPRAEVKIGGIRKLTPCTKVVLDVNDGWVAFQWLRVFEWDWNFKDGTTTLIGIVG